MFCELSGRLKRSKSENCYYIVMKLIYWCVMEEFCVILKLGRVFSLTSCRRN